MILNKLLLAAVMGAFLAGAVSEGKTTETLSKVTTPTPTTTTAKPTNQSSPNITNNTQRSSKSLEDPKPSEETRPKNKTSEELRAPKKFPMNLMERACDVMGCDTVAEAFAAFANTMRKATYGNVPGEVAQTMGRDSPESTAGPTANAASGATGATGNNEMCFDRLGCFSMGSPWSARGLSTPEEIDTLFRIYTRDTPSHEEAVVISPVDADAWSADLILPAGAVIPAKPTFFLVHGFNDRGEASWLLDLKDAILSKLDANVFIVDWKKGAVARISYTQVSSNTRIVAAEIAGVIQALGEYNIHPKDIHIIGHSLGSHIAGYVGKDFDGGIARITALDPAQPGFEGHPPEVRLAQSDALFVDVLHTNAAPFIPAFGLGMMGAVGDVDFYLNGGAVQPGCLLPPPPPVTALFTDPVNVFGDMFACSHKRAMVLFTEAIKGSCVFWGKARKLDRILERSVSFADIAKVIGQSSDLPKQPAWCKTTTCVPIGLLTPLYGVRGNFDVTTTGEAPYCLESLIPEPAISTRIGGGASSLLSKLSGGVLGQRRKRSEHQPLENNSIAETDITKRIKDLSSSLLQKLPTGWLEQMKRFEQQLRDSSILEPATSESEEGGASLLLRRQPFTVPEVHGKRKRSDGEQSQGTVVSKPANSESEKGGSSLLLRQQPFSVLGRRKISDEEWSQDLLKSKPAISESEGGGASVLLRKQPGQVLGQKKRPRREQPRETTIFSELLPKKP